MRTFPDHDMGLKAGRALRIALFVHAFYPDHVYGTEFYTLALARAFVARGHKVVVVTAREAGEPPQAREVESYVHAGIRVLRIDGNRHPPRNVREAYDQPSLAPLLAALLRRIAPDVVHVCHLANFTAVLPQVAASLAIPVFATLTDFFNICLTGMLEQAHGGACGGPDASRLNCMRCGLTLRSQEQPFSPFWRALGHPALRDACAWAFTRFAPFLLFSGGADARAVLSRPQVMLAAMAHYRAAIAPTAFLENAFRAQGAPTRLVRSNFGIEIDRRPKPARPAGPLRLGFIGQLLSHKGPHLVLQALRALPPGSATLDIWGSEQLAPDYARDLRAVAERMPVRFRGLFDPADTATVMAGLDVLVLPSLWYENGPLTLLKALATHTPVVVSDVPGMTEFVNEGVNGFAFRRGDAEALAAVLRRFTDDPALAPRMSAATRYTRTEADMADDVLALYGAAASGTGAAPRAREA
ncbi:glycosyltransferase [Xanthobacter sp. V0B-10]|uniref:glycosyltransferase n=1 Tax=Xanthobacter albus TaxID=3119929 RepID=UPI00372896C8